MDLIPGKNKLGRERAPLKITPVNTAYCVSVPIMRTEHFSTRLRENSRANAYDNHCARGPTSLKYSGERLERKRRSASLSLTFNFRERNQPVSGVIKGGPRVDTLLD